MYHRRELTAWTGFAARSFNVIYFVAILSYIGLMDGMTGEGRMMLSTDLLEWAPAAFKRLNTLLMPTLMAILP